MCAGVGQLWGGRVLGIPLAPRLPGWARACRHLAPGSVSRVTSQPVGGVASAHRGPCPSRAGPWGRGVPHVADRGHAAPGSTGCLRCPAVSQPCSDSGSNTSPVAVGWPCQAQGPAGGGAGQTLPEALPAGSWSGTAPRREKGWVRWRGSQRGGSAGPTGLGKESGRSHWAGLEGQLGTQAASWRDERG